MASSSSTGSRCLLTRRAASITSGSPDVEAMWLASIFVFFLFFFYYFMNFCYKRFLYLFWSKQKQQLRVTQTEEKSWQVLGHVEVLFMLFVLYASQEVVEVSTGKIHHEPANRREEWSNRNYSRTDNNSRSENKKKKKKKKKKEGRKRPIRQRFVGAKREKRAGDKCHERTRRRRVASFVCEEMFLRLSSLLERERWRSQSLLYSRCNHPSSCPGATRSRHFPLLAIWFYWSGKSSSRSILNPGALVAITNQQLTAPTIPILSSTHSLGQVPSELAAVLIIHLKIEDFPHTPWSLLLRGASSFSATPLSSGATRLWCAPLVFLSACGVG